MPNVAPRFEDTPEFIAWRRTHPPIMGAAPEADGEVETPASDAPADTDWQKRYTDLQPEYTRATQALKSEQEIWEDEQAVIAKIAEKYPHLVDFGEEPDEPDEPDVDLDDEPRFAELSPEDKQRLAAHDEWIAQQRQKEATGQFNTDLSEEAEGRELAKQARDWIFNRTVELGDGRENLKKALKEWTEFEDGLGESYMERVRKSKRTPHVTQNGQAATGTKPIEDMTREEHTAWMVEQALAREHQ